jgi:hypothetical protein
VFFQRTAGVIEERGGDFLSVVNVRIEICVLYPRQTLPNLVPDWRLNALSRLGMCANFMLAVLATVLLSPLKFADVLFRCQTS